MTKIQIGSLLEFVPDRAGEREARLRALIEEHMGKDMRDVMDDYLDAPGRVDELELELCVLRDKLEEARADRAMLEEALEELRFSRR